MSKENLIRILWNFLRGPIVLFSLSEIFDKFSEEFVKMLLEFHWNNGTLV